MTDIVQGSWQDHLAKRSSYHIDMTNLVPTGPKSYSQFISHSKCGYQFAANKVWKHEVKPEDPGPALVRGNEVHDSIENFFKGSDHLHPDLVNYKQWMWGLRQDYDCYPEYKWAFRIDMNDTWTAVDFNDPSATWRGLFDLKLIPKRKVDRDIDIQEWKTGRIYPDHKWQRRLYNTASIEDEPGYDNYQVTTVYFDQKKNVPMMYPGGRGSKDSFDAHKLAKAGWRHKATFMDCPDTYIPNPGAHCRWCPHSRFKGGQCPVG